MAQIHHSFIISPLEALLREGEQPITHEDSYKSQSKNIDQSCKYPRKLSYRELWNDQQKNYNYDCPTGKDAN